MGEPANQAAFASPGICPGEPSSSSSLFPSVQLSTPLSPEPEVRKVPGFGLPPQDSLAGLGDSGSCSAKPRHLSKLSLIPHETPPVWQVDCPWPFLGKKSGALPAWCHPAQISAVHREEGSVGRPSGKIPSYVYGTHTSDWLHTLFAPL